MKSKLELMSKSTAHRDQHIGFTVSKGMRDELIERARERNESLSMTVRAACAEYLAPRRWPGRRLPEAKAEEAA